MRILVVDDYPGAAEMSCTLLRLMGHDAIGAITGQDALSRVAAVDPDLVFLDLELPDMSGHEVARQLRARRGRRVFIVAVTGSNEAEDRDLDGIDMQIRKPASAVTLSEVIRAAERLERPDHP